MHIHGGDVESFFRQYGREPLDFSANVSPLGLPHGVREAVIASLDNAGRYPDPACRALREGISASQSVPAEHIICGNGAADVIFRLAAAVKTESVLVTAPTFAEYEAAAVSAGRRVKRHTLTRDRSFDVTPAILDDITEETGLVFICQPNNPTGRTVDKGLLLKILDKCRECGSVLALDECFVDFLEKPREHTLMGYIEDNKNLFIFKAFTKLYAMAGLRLGCGFCSDERLMSSLYSSAQPWAVSTPAQAAGLAALGEREYSERLMALIAEEKPFLIKRLKDAGAEVYGSAANFIFFRSPDTELHSKLRERGIMIRDCSNYIGLGGGWYRIAIRGRADNELLARVIESILLDK